jgi:DNA polymerase III sliding clamp (beta) subunit (PCNA family)
MNTIKFIVTSDLRRAIKELNYVSDRRLAKHAPVFNTIRITQSQNLMQMTRINDKQKMVFSYLLTSYSDADLIIDYKFFNDIVSKSDSGSTIKLAEIGNWKCLIEYYVDGEWFEVTTELFHPDDFYDKFSAYETNGVISFPNDFRDAVYVCKTASSADEDRWVLNSVYFHQKERGLLCLVGTDGKRLNLSPDFRIDLRRSFILPTKAVPDTPSFIKKLWTVTFLYHPADKEKKFSAITIEAGNFEITTELLEGYNYPTYWKVFPKRGTEWNAIVKLNDETRDRLIAGLKSIPVADRKKPHLILKLVSGMGIILYSLDKQTQIRLDIPLEGGEFEATFNRDFLIDLLRVGHTRLHFSDEKSPIYATAPSGFTSLLMPYYINRI